MSIPPAPAAPDAAARRDEDTPASAELQRFLVLFDRLVRHSDATLGAMAPQRLDWAPIENASTRFGTRVSRITARALLVHTVLAERNWITQIPRCPAGGEIALPADPQAAERLQAAPDVRTAALALHEDNLTALRGFGLAELNKPVRFVGRDWTGMGLLWGMYAHRAFHLGNIDIYARQSDVTPPEFFEFDPAAMA